MRGRVALLASLLALAGCAEPSTVIQPDEDFQQTFQATESTGVIRGVVIDNSITPVEGVKVVLINQGQEAMSDVNGQFGFQDLEPGTYFLEASKPGFNGTQTSVEVVAGVDAPPVLKVYVTRNPSTAPYLQSLQWEGYLACGVAIGLTSVGCTIYGQLAELTESSAIFREYYEQMPSWVQGELIWEQTQPLGGMFIWEIVNGGTNNHRGYRETTTSPALAYVDNRTLEEHEEEVMERGLSYRFFGGPHPLCPPTGYPNSFGCGVTLEQEATVYAHQFYNFQPFEGWRFSNDGPPVVPS